MALEKCLRVVEAVQGQGGGAAIGQQSAADDPRELLGEHGFPGARGARDGDHEALRMAEVLLVEPRQQGAPVLGPFLAGDAGGQDVLVNGDVDLPVQERGEGIDRQCRHGAGPRYKRVSEADR